MGKAIFNMNLLVKWVHLFVVNNPFYMHILSTFGLRFFNIITWQKEKR
jgi:hypothetical protein